MPKTEQRIEEVGKYRRSYDACSYKMGSPRRRLAVHWLNGVGRGSYLDVGCGRGEMLREAKAMGFDPVCGTEVVPQLTGGEVRTAFAHALPFGDAAFDVVTMFDVIEHLLPGDDEAACRELGRVARRHVILTANNRPSFNADGDDLHINRRSYDEWDALFRDWFEGGVTRLGGEISEGWRIDL